MEVKKGYKQTEVGVIPEDWGVTNLGKRGTFTKGSGIRKDEAQSGLIPCIRYGELYTVHNEIIKKFYSHISEEVARKSKRIFPNDILFAGSGETKDEIGKCASFIHSVEAYAGGDVIVFSPKNVNSNFLGYLLNSPSVNKQKASKGQGDAVVHINSRGLTEILIPLPPTLAEQEAIANALSDVDSLIQSLERLIAKKRLIKKGAMQELLKPQEGWVEKRLGEIADIYRGASPRPIDSPVWFDENSTVGWVRISDVSNSGKFLFTTTQKLSFEGIKRLFDATSGI